MQKIRKKNPAPLRPVISLLCVVLVGLLMLLGLLLARPAQPVAAWDLPSPETSPALLRTMSEAELAQGDLVLVNQANAYDPSNAQELTTVYGHMNDAYFVRDSQLSVCGRILDPLNAWMQDFKDATGIAAVNVVAGHRTVEYQQELYDNALASHGADYAASYFSDPGYSEHHTGLAVDFATYDPASGASGDFTGAGEYSWLLENAWRYGFVQRYPPDKKDCTGIAYESWHFRYVGVPHAWVLYTNGLVLEEYIQLLRDHPADKPLTFSCDGTEYTVYFCPGLQVTVPESGDYTISGNNADGFIVTVTGA